MVPMEKQELFQKDHYSTAVEKVSGIWHVLVTNGGDKERWVAKIPGKHRIQSEILKICRRSSPDFIQFLNQDTFGLRTLHESGRLHLEAVPNIEHGDWTLGRTAHRKWWLEKGRWKTYDFTHLKFTLKRADWTGSHFSLDVSPLDSYSRLTNGARRHCQLTTKANSRESLQAPPDLVQQKRGLCGEATPNPDKIYEEGSIEIAMIFRDEWRSCSATTVKTNHTTRGEKVRFFTFMLAVWLERKLRIWPVIVQGTVFLTETALTERA